ncbi:MAG TPA: SIS domain-containing protein [Chloroflexota bacterium]|nr:SIS domain-containing protein [Chloroflexota bacterium]
MAQAVSHRDIDTFIQHLYDAWRRDSTVFIAGNGGSASTASHFAADLNKYTSSEADHRFRALCLNDDIALVSALTNDDGWDNIYSYQLEGFMREADVLVAISVHGGEGGDKAGEWSQNLLKAARVVRVKRGKLLALVGFDGGMLHKIADASVLVPINSTPQVEGFHLVLTHLIAARLKQAIGDRDTRV